MKFAVIGEKSDFYEFKNNLDLYNKKNKTYISAQFYENNEDFLNELKEKNFEIVFLVHSSSANNILNVAMNIKKIAKNCNIVFCSESNKYAVLGYKIGFVYYILLPLEYEDFDFVLKKYFNVTDNIIIKHNWQKTLIPTKNIMFAEKQGHNIIIHTPTQKFSTRMTFRKFAENFKKKENFVHCIRGTIVNLNYVSLINSQNFVMKNNYNIPIRRQDRKKFKDMFFKFQINKNL